MIASSAAAAAIASSASCGAADSGSPVLAVVSPAALVMSVPSGTLAVRAGGTRPPAVASHHWVTGSGVRDC